MEKLGTKSSGIAMYYNKQSENEDELKLKVLQRREQQETMGMYGTSACWNGVNWPDKKDEEGIQAGKVLEYPEDGEQTLIWCPGKVLNVVKRDDKVIKADIKWDRNFIRE